MSTYSEWIKVYEAFDYLNAELFKNHLVENIGIDAVVLNKQDSSYHFGKCEVHVMAASEAEAKAALEQWVTSTNFKI